MAFKGLVSSVASFSHTSIRQRSKYLILAVVVLIFLYFLNLHRQWGRLQDVLDVVDVKIPHHLPSLDTNRHVIHKLSKDARLRFKQLLGKRTDTLEQAASRYRERRGRHPPPGFDKWFAAAQEKEAIVVEDFFDRIYHDINPFWALDPKTLRRMIQEEEHFIRIRDGKAWFESHHLELRQPWVQRWTELVEEMMPNLPDLDMVLNVMDETRVLVPWEKIAEYVAEEQRTRDIFSPSDAVTEYTKYKDEPDEPTIKVDWIRDQLNQYWDHYRVTCPPDTPGRNVSSLPNLDDSPTYPTEPMPFTVDGFIQNFTQASDPCLQPHLRGMHGTFIESVSMGTTHSLYPIFGGCKLPGNNEMLIPAGMILDSYDLFSGGDSHGGPWNDKKNKLVWRGVASGGRHKKENWWGYQRLRFVQMMNGTTVSLVENGEDGAAPTFKLPTIKQHQTQAQKKGKLGQWVASLSNTGFTDYTCFPHQEDNGCSYLEPYMELLGSVHMKDQYDYKFLPDIDGNSYSGRFRAFMRSTSLVLKSTIYSEWHDDRLVPWVHFVPFDNTYVDIYAIIEYYLGHDDEAQMIAEESRQWSESVMRREDMLLYVWRLLLEYARVMDPSRDRLAYVEDLMN
ncbi:glycosyltransferase family 90 protein [Poronia punctata]|nr:glycosyltransferase family 90 protein [Poronia punctata]